MTEVLDFTVKRDRDSDTWFAGFMVENGRKWLIVLLLRPVIGL